jgi:transketolase
MDAVTLKKAKVPTRLACAERMKDYGDIDPDFVVFDSDIGYSTYSYLFGDRFPARYFNLGIAEVGTMATAAGMSAEGRVSVVCGYGVFLTMRAVEAVRSFICYPNLNVKIMSSHGGVTAAIDGVTHQATEDISAMITLPNMKVLVPSDPVSAARCFETAVKTPGPVFVRLMRDPLFDLYGDSDQFPMGGSKQIRSGGDVTIVTYGDIVFQAMEAAEILASQGVESDVIDAYSLKPYDKKAILKSVSKTGCLVVAENHQARNGFAYELSNLLLKEAPVPFENLGFRDTFAESGDYPSLLRKYGLSAEHITKAALGVVARRGKTD